MKQIRYHCDFLVKPGLQGTHRHREDAHIVCTFGADVRRGKRKRHQP